MPGSPCSVQLSQLSTLWASSNASSLCRGSWPDTASPGASSRSLCSMKLDFLCLGQSPQPWGQPLALGQPSLMDTKRVFDVSVWSAFYSLLGWNGDFQGPDKQNQKLEVLNTGWGQSRLTAVTTQNTVFILALFINYCIFSICTTVNLHLPIPVFRSFSFQFCKNL